MLYAIPKTKYLKIKEESPHQKVDNARVCGLQDTVNLDVTLCVDSETKAPNQNVGGGMQVFF